MDTHSPAASAAAVQLAVSFLSRVWGSAPDLDAIDELMTDDYVIHSAGTDIRGRDAFKAWVRQFQERLAGARNEIVETFANPDGTRVVSRWVCTGRNNGIFGLPADGRPVSFSGIAVWSVRDGRLAECWVERAALETYLALSNAAPTARDR